MSDPPSPRARTTYIFDRFGQVILVPMAGLAVSTVVGGLLGAVWSFMTGKPVLHCIAGAMVVAVPLVFLVLWVIRIRGEAARMARLRCDKCANALEPPSGGHGRPAKGMRYQCRRCGMWTDWIPRS